LVIFKGKNIWSSWKADNPLGANVTVSEKGWIDNVLKLEWLQQFEVDSAQISMAGHPRLLVLDGHVSNQQTAFLKAAKESNIEIFRLPPHCTHALQPLDVGVFRPLSQAYRAQVNSRSRQRLLIKKEHFLR
jgi:hypothetical protein